MTNIYLDHNASTPLAPRVLDCMQKFLAGDYGNPSSGHWASENANAALVKARSQVADFAGCKPEEIIFTSGGTESNNLALKGLWFHPKREGNHIITSSIEHDAIRKPLMFLKKQGARITILRVNRDGMVDPDDVRKAITPETSLITIMHANNETGVIQPISEISEIAKEHGVLLHTDAAQSAGKISIHVDELGVDMLSIASHKMYGPKAIGALYVREGTKIEPHNHGAGHEMGRRAGTESALLAAGFGAACELAGQGTYEHVRSLRDYFWEQLQSRFAKKVEVNGNLLHTVPNTLNVSFANKVGAEILYNLNGVAASTGSACHAGCVDMSAVLIAMKVPMHLGMGAIRFSLGHQNTREEIDTVVSQLSEIV